MVGVISDVNDLKKQAEEWKQRSRIDLFSGLLNKETVLESISARIGKKGARFALLLIDFDGFKEINDTYGHLVGDDVIREFSRILRAAFPDDLVGRFGGDEFILLTEMQTLRDASRAVSAVLGICVRLPGLPEMRLSQSVGRRPVRGRRKRSHPIARIGGQGALPLQTAEERFVYGHGRRGKFSRAGNRASPARIRINCRSCATPPEFFPGASDFRIILSNPSLWEKSRVLPARYSPWKNGGSRKIRCRRRGGKGARIRERDVCCGL